MTPGPKPLRVRGLAFDARQDALLLDFDGTVVDLVPNPEDARPSLDLVHDVEAIGGRQGLAFAFVTGRALAQLDAFFGGPLTAASGNHGAEERRGSGEPTRILIPPVPEDAVAALQAWARQEGGILENKTYSLAIHLSPARAGDDECAAVIQALGHHQTAYAVRKVGRTYEVLRQGITKGRGIARLLESPAFAGRRPVYIGDDVGVDGSLRVVTDLGGALVPVAPKPLAGLPVTALAAPPDALSVADVRAFIAALARTLPLP